MIKNTIHSYGQPAKFFHWIMALLFLGMFSVGYIMTNTSKSSLIYSLYDLHKATGLVLFNLVALRLIWRFINVQPAPPKLPAWQLFAAKSIVFILYFCMIAMPITGFLTSTLGGHDISFYTLFNIAPLAHNKDWSEFFSDAHDYLSYTMLVAFIIHMTAAFYHHYVLNDEVLRKILPNEK